MPVTLTKKCLFEIDELEAKGIYKKTEILITLEKITISTPFC